MPGSRVSAVVLLVLSEATALRHVPCSPRSPVLCRAAVAAQEAWPVTVADSEEKFQKCAELCGEAFPDNPASKHGAVLRAPASLSNVYFNVEGEASVAVIESEGRTVGCAQIVPCVIREEASDMPGDRAFWVQYVCTAQAAQRRGVGKALMAWCEREASRAAKISRKDTADLWLAVNRDNEPALNLYKKLGFEADPRMRKGRVVMTKTVTVSSVPEENSHDDSGEVGPASLFNLREDDPGPWSVVFEQAGGYFGLAAIALAGDSLMLAPFLYKSDAGDVVRSLFFSAGVSGLARDVAIGLVAAAGSVILYELVSDEEKIEDLDIVKALEDDPSVAAQQLAIWRVTSAGTKDALFPIALWQLVASTSEELYYRSLVLNGGHRLMALAGAPGAVSLTFPLFVSTALFSLAHSSWANSDFADVDDNDERTGELGLEWIKSTAPFGLLFGILFLATEDRVIAPLVAHTAYNTFAISRIAKAHRNADDRERLADIFDRVPTTTQRVVT